MGDDGTVSVDSDAYLFEDGDFMYGFRVSYGPVHWRVEKKYADFVTLHKSLRKEYGREVIPHLTGEVAFWKKESTATAEERHPKLLAYLNHLLEHWAEWKPPFVVFSPHPTDASKTVAHQGMLFEFLCFNSNISLIQATLAAAIAAEHAKAAADGNGAVLSPAISARAAATGKSPRPMDEDCVSSSSGCKAPSSADAPVSQNASTPPSAPQLKAREFMTGVASATSAVCVPSIGSDIIGGSVEYTIDVALFGGRWSVQKTASDMQQLYYELAEKYPAATVTTVEETIVSARKSEERSSAACQAAFAAYLRHVVQHIDQWAECTDTCSIKVKKRQPGVAPVIVCFNRHIFHFLDILNHTDDLSAELAESCIQRKREALPENVKEVLQEKEARDRKIKIEQTIAARQELFVMKEQAAVDDLCKAIQSLDDDKDVISLCEAFIKEEHEHGAAKRIRRKESFIAKTTTKEAPRSDTPVAYGITSQQLAQIAHCVFFNDTRSAVIKLLSSMLADIEALSDVLNTLDFEWEPVREWMEASLSK